MKLEVERDRCEGYGFCEQAAPDLMTLDDDGQLEFLVDPVPAEREEAARAAVRVCPVAALRLVS